MSYIITNDTSQKFLPKFIAMNPYQVYLNQIRSAIEPIRYQRQGLSYIPPQMGGISGQRQVINQNVVLQIIDFEVN